MRLARFVTPLLAAAATLVWAAPLRADSAPDPSSVTEIRLGTPPPAPSVDRTRVSAVERYLALRQDGSASRAGGRAPRAAAGPKGSTAEDLYGPIGTRLVAFDFPADSFEPPASGKASQFQVPVYLLFANADGQVVESRDETLVFSGGKGAWSCTSRRTSASMAWSADGVRSRAATLGVSEELKEVQSRLRDGTVGRPHGLAYSVADIVKEGDGRVVVHCIRFQGDPGRRGFDVQTDPLVLSRQRGELRIESH